MSDVQTHHPHNNSVLEPMVVKLQQFRPLAEDHQQALLDLPYRVMKFRPHEYIVREGDKPVHSCLILSGFVFRQKAAGNGGRQIFSIHMRGDLADLQNSLLGTADHNLQAVSQVELASIPIAAIQDIAFSRPAVGAAMWRETLVDASIFREWTLNVGRRKARARAAHLLCEFGLRLELARLGERDSYEIPLTQEQLADALGLTAVHTNRTLMALGEDGLIARTNRSVRIVDWDGLAQAGDFDSAYLHLPQPAETAPQ